jgi:hypothetical protein
MKHTPKALGNTPQALGADSPVARTPLDSGSGRPVRCYFSRYAWMMRWVAVLLAVSVAVARSDT